MGRAMASAFALLAGVALVTVSGQSLSAPTSSESPARPATRPPTRQITFAVLAKAAVDFHGVGGNVHTFFFEHRVAQHTAMAFTRISPPQHSTGVAPLANVAV